MEQDPTIRFQHTLPYLLYSVSPQLAALHATRARRLSPHQIQSPSSTCPKCGAYLLAGNSSTRSLRLHSGKPPHCRALRRLCFACGGVQITRFDVTDTPVALASSTMLTHASPSPSLPLVDVPRKSKLGPSPTLPCPPPAISQQPKSRPKKKTGLQDLLSRNREKEQKEKNSKPGAQGGLAAFLEGL